MPPVFSIIPSTAEVENASGSVEISISNPGGDWTATTTSDWVTVSPTTGYGSSVVTVSYGENLDNIERTGIVTIETEVDYSGVFTLTQAGKAAASSGNIFVGDNNVYVMLGDSEIAAIYAGEELIYPFNLGTLTGITIENITWDTDVPASGGTATYENCSYKVVAHYDSGKSRTVTSKATVTGSLAVPATTAETREMVGVLQLTATYEGFTATGSVDVYQESVGLIPSDYQEIQYIYNQTQISYIPTDIYFTSDMWFEFKVRNLGISQLPERHIFSGSLFDTQVQANAASWFIRGNRTQTQRVRITNAFPANTDVTAVLYKGNDNIVLNGVNKGTLTPKGTTDTYKAFFFTHQEKAPVNNDSDRLGLNGYLYYYIVGSNTSGEELYHFVPVRRKSDNLVGLYEIINRAFYGPGNSNTFVAGPDVQ